MNEEYDSAFKAIADLPSFIAYLEETSPDEWLTDHVRTEDNSKNCVMGHLMNFVYGKEQRTPGLAWDAFEEMWATTYMSYDVNDGRNLKYQQATAKDRIIAYLKDLWMGLEKPTWQYMEDDHARAVG